MPRWRSLRNVPSSLSPHSLIHHLNGVFPPSPLSLMPPIRIMQTDALCFVRCVYGGGMGSECLIFFRERRL